MDTSQFEDGRLSLSIWTMRNVQQNIRMPVLVKMIVLLLIVSFADASFMDEVGPRLSAKRPGYQSFHTFYNLPINQTEQEDLNSFLEPSTRRSKIIGFPNCKIKVKTSSDGCKIESNIMQPCKVQPDFYALVTLQTFSADWKTKVHKFLTTTIEGNKIGFVKSIYDKCNSLLYINGTSKETLAISGRALTFLPDAIIEVKFDPKNAKSYKSIEYSLKGKITIRMLKLTVRISKSIGQQYGTITGTSDGQIKFQVLLMYFGFQARQFVNIGIVKMPRLANLIFKSPTIHGAVSEKDGIQFGFTTMTSEKSVFKSATVHFFVHLKVTGKNIPVIFAKINPAIHPPLIFLKSVLKKGTAKKISLPMLGNVKQHYGFIVAKDTFQLNFGQNLSALDYPKQLAKGTTIKQGARIIAALQVRKYFEDCNPGKKFDNIPEFVLSHAEIKGIAIQMVYQEKVNITIGNLLMCLSPEERANLPTEIFQSDDGVVTVRTLVYNPIIKAWKVAVALPFKKKVHASIDIQQIIVVISKEKAGKPIKFEATANAKFLNQTLQAVISKEDSDYTMTFFLESVNISEAVTKLSGSQKSIEMVKDSGVKAENCKFEITLGSAFSARLMGTLTVKTTGLGVELYTFPRRNKRAVAYGFVAKNFDIKDLLHMYVNISSSTLWLDDVTVQVAMYQEFKFAPKDKGKEAGKEEGKEEKEGGKEKEGDKGKDEKEGDEKKEGEDKKGGEDEEEEDEYSFETEGLSELPFMKGLYIRVVTVVPKDCKKSKTCEMIKSMVGTSAEMVFQGHIDKDGVQLNASFPTVQNITDNFYMEETVLVIDMKRNKESRQGIGATLKTRDPVLKFNALFAVQASGVVELSLTMVGMWKKPFGVEVLAFGNLLLKMEYSLGKGMPRLEFGGELWLGKIGNKKEIKIKCYIGYNPSNSKDNYIYASVNKLSVQAIIDAFEIKYKPSKALGNSGFPEGLVISYTAVDGGITLDDFDITIEQGFYFKGMLSIMDFNVSATIQLNYPDIMIDAKMTPVDIANGLITITRSPTNKKQGPMMYVRITEFQVAVRIEGYAAILGSSKAIVLHISNTGFKFSYADKFMGFIESNVSVSANWGVLKQATFQIKACASFSLRSLGDKIIEYLGKFSKMATAAIDKAMAKVESARAAFKRAQAKVNSWKGGISRYRDRLRRRKQELDRKKRELRYSCRSRCGTWCIGTFGWNSRCWKFLWWWAGCPTWIPCKWRIPDAICLAGCELKKLGNKIAIWAEKLGINILIGLTKVADFALSAANAVIGLASGVIDLAKGVLSFVKAAVEIGTLIATQLIKFATRAFELDYLCLSAKLNVAKTACFGLDLKCKIFGASFEYHGFKCLNSEFEKEMATDTVQKKYPETKEMKKKVAESEKKISEVDRKENELKSKEDGAQREVNKLSKRYHVYRLRDNPALRQLFEDEDEQYSTRNEEMRKIFREYAPWNLDIDEKEAFGSEVPLREGSANERAEVPCAGNSSCSQLSNVADKYAVLRDGLSVLAESMKIQQDSYQSTKRNMLSSSDSLAKRANFIEKTRQMTKEEREDLYYWVKKVKQGTSKYIDKNEKLLKKAQITGTKNFKKQLRYILKAEGGGDIQSYLQKLNSCGEEAHKRSAIDDAAGNEALRKVHEGAVQLFSSMEREGYDLKGALDQWSSMVANLEHIAAQCK